MLVPNDSEQEMHLPWHTGAVAGDPAGIVLKPFSGSYVCVWIPPDGVRLSY